MFDRDANANHRDRLLDLFRQSLEKPLSERFFDEDDLIEIFDYAGDLGDDYLRIEAMMCAARFYPDSAEMKQRRAIFYSQYGDDVCSRFLNDNSAESGMLWDILRIRRNFPDGDEATKSLDFLLGSYDNFSDEEIIQLVDLASSLGRYDWLKTNLPALRKKASYLMMLLYEITVAADSNRDIETAISLLEELTELDPFNHNYWQMLAKEYYAAGDNDKAVSAIDYSLAIDSSDLQSHLVKANLLYARELPIGQVIEFTEKIVSDDPDMLDAIKFLANLYNEDNRPQASVQILRNYIDRNPRDVTLVVPELITYHPDDTDRLLDLFYEYSEDNSQLIWASWAQNLSVCGFSDLARKVAECYERNSGIRLIMMFSIEDTFNAGDSNATIEAIEQFLGDIHNNETNLPALLVMHTLSLARVGRHEQAMSLINMVEKMTSVSNYKSLQSRLEYMGMKKILADIRNRIKSHPDPADWKDFDPITTS